MEFVKRGTMRKLILIFLMSGILFSCNTTKKTMDKPVGDTTEVSVDWDGIYMGMYKNEKGENILTKLILSTNKQFTEESLNMSTGERKEWKSQFAWNNEGSRISIMNKDAEMKLYLVGENVIWLLNESGKRKKQADGKDIMFTKNHFQVMDKYWKLISVKGNTVRLNDNNSKEPHIEFKSAEGRYFGFGGCNGYQGVFEFSGYDEIRLENGMSTLIACDLLNIEQLLYQSIQEVKRFEIEGDEMRWLNEEGVEIALFKHRVN